MATASAVTVRRGNDQFRGLFSDTWVVRATLDAGSYGDRAIGVVSAHPAYMMNSELEGGTYIALKGRVPVKVTGAIRKGQRLVAYNNGTAVAAVPHANDVFGIALESSDDTGAKLIEAVIL